MILPSSPFLYIPIILRTHKDSTLASQFVDLDSVTTNLGLKRVHWWQFLQPPWRTIALHPMPCSPVLMQIKQPVSYVWLIYQTQVPILLRVTCLTKLPDLSHVTMPCITAVLLHGLREPTAAQFVGRILTGLNLVLPWLVSVSFYRSTWWTSLLTSL